MRVFSGRRPECGFGFHGRGHRVPGLRSQRRPPSRSRGFRCFSSGLVLRETSVLRSWDNLGGQSPAWPPTAPATNPPPALACGGTPCRSRERSPKTHRTRKDAYAAEPPRSRGGMTRLRAGLTTRYTIKIQKHNQKCTWPHLKGSTAANYRSHRYLPGFAGG